MRLSEARISYISHRILDGLWGDELVDFEDEERVLTAIRGVITKYLKVDEEVDEAVRRKLRTMSRRVVEGSREWDVLYEKFFGEELNKRGR
ncbi:MAG: DUF507 family protein [Deltaproteobacteria bacterium]|nr:DUF507 family protein [Deltaproteobacteria bacterium]